MAFSQLNGIALCNLVTINGISRNATNQFIGQTQGVSCSHEPILTGGPEITKADICTNVLDRSPSGTIKYTDFGAPGTISGRSKITSSSGACSGANKLPIGWYVFFGPDGPGYTGYQIIEMDGSSSCFPATVTGCS